MKYHSFEHFFTVLGCKQRVDILQLLDSEGPMSVTAITQALNAEQSAISHSLKELRQCHFVAVEPQGKERIYSINGDTITPLLQLIERHVDKYCIQVHHERSQK